MNDSGTRLHALLDAPAPLRAEAQGYDDLRLCNLLARSAAGDVAAFMDFYDATIPLVWRLESRRGQSPEVAQEAARRRYLLAWRSAGDQSTSGLSPRAWLLSLRAGHEAAR